MTFKKTILITLNVGRVNSRFYLFRHFCLILFSSKALIDMGNNQLISLQETKRAICYVVSRHSIKSLSLGGKTRFVVRMLPYCDNAYKDSQLKSP